MSLLIIFGIIYGIFFIGTTMGDYFISIEEGIKPLLKSIRIGLIWPIVWIIRIYIKIGSI